MSLNLEPKHGAAGIAEQPQDFRARLRARREQLAKGSTRLFALPGYDAAAEVLGGELLIRYRRVTVAEYQELVRGAGPDVDTVARNAQFLIGACDEILFRDETGLHPLVEGHKTTFVINLETSESLATFMGVDHIVEARDQMVAVFGDNELALNDHSDAVIQWMVSTNAADGDTALGEA